MATQKEIAQFLQLALRLCLVSTETVGRWIDSVVEADDVVPFPFTDLAAAARLPSGTVDELLGQVSGKCDLHLPGRMILALIRRRLREGMLTPGVAINFALEIGYTGPLTEDERYQADWLEDSLCLAREGTYGSVDEVHREIREFFDRYAEFEQHIPHGGLPIR